MEQDVNKQVKEAIDAIQDPYAGKSLGGLKWVKSAVVGQGVASVHFELGLLPLQEPGKSSKNWPQRLCSLWRA